MLDIFASQHYITGPEAIVKKTNHLPHTHHMAGGIMSGGDEEDRTLDLTDANRTLSQLSYAPI